MERRRLGPTASDVGVVGLGTGSWPTSMDVNDGVACVRMLVEAGGDLIDVNADRPRWEFAGHVLAVSGLRNETFLSVRSSGGPSRRELLAGLDQVLAGLNVDHVDLWTMRGWDARLPWEESLAALTLAVTSGRAHYVGVEPTMPWQAGVIGAALAVHPGRTPLAAVTVRQSLLERAHHSDVEGVSSAVGASVIAISPLAGGVLTGKYRHGTPADSRGASERDGAHLQRYRAAWSRPIVDGLMAAADGLGSSPGAIALAWAREQPGVCCTVVGVRTVHQWRAALASADIRLPSEISAVLDDVSARASGWDTDV